MKVIDFVLDMIAIVICIAFAFGAGFFLISAVAISMWRPWEVLLILAIVSFVAWRAFRHA